MLTSKKKNNNNGNSSYMVFSLGSFTRAGGSIPARPCTLRNLYDKDFYWWKKFNAKWVGFFPTHLQVKQDIRPEITLFLVSISAWVCLGMKLRFAFLARSHGTVHDPTKHVKCRFLGKY